jgi:hypothetical protein
MLRFASDDDCGDRAALLIGELQNVGAARRDRGCLVPAKT